MSLDSRHFLLALALAVALSTFPLAQGEENSSINAYRHVEALTENTHRLAGTRAENLAVTYIENEFESYGFSTRIDDFTLKDAYVFQESHLAIVNPVVENVKFVPLIRSPATEGVLLENLVYLENLPENLSPLRDDAVLVERKNFGEIREISPEAIIIYEENMPAWSNVYPSNSLKSPAVTISYRAAKDFIGLQRENQVKIELKLEAKIEDRTSRNVVATLPGESEETIIVAAHHDSVLTPGAVDDASGVAVMLETARELSDESLHRTVKFVSFGAEEYGLVGSRRYAKESEEQEVVGVLDFDSICPGPSDGLRVGSEGGSGKDSTPWLGEYVRGVAEDLEMKPSCGTLKEAGGYSDYLSFVEEGVPATWVYWVSDREDRLLWPVHTLEDNLDSIDENQLEQTVRMSVHSVRKLSGEDLEGWRWRYRFPERFSVFTVLTSIVIISSLAGYAYFRYVRGRRRKKIIWTTVLIVSVTIFILYVILLSGVVQVF